MIIGFISGGFIGIVIGILFMSICQVAEDDDKFNECTSLKPPFECAYGDGDLYQCPTCAALLLKSTKLPYCPHCKTDLDWKGIDEDGKRKNMERS